MSLAAAAVGAGVLDAASGAAIAAAAPTLGSLATAASIAGAGISAVGAVTQGQAGKASAKYNAAIAGQNAELATQNSQIAGAEGEENTAVAGAKTRAQIGATLANQGASGIDVNSGSDVDTRQSEAKLGMLNALNVRSQAARQSYGYQTEAASDLGQQTLDKAQEKSSSTAGYLNAAGDVLGGASNTYLKFFKSNDPTGGVTDISFTGE